MFLTKRKHKEILKKSLKEFKDLIDKLDKEIVQQYDEIEGQLKYIDYLETVDTDELIEIVTTKYVNDIGKRG